MSEAASSRLTRGCLPAGAFEHLEPTAVGLVDLERPLTVQHPGEPKSAAPHRDALVSVRLHGEPLGIVHLKRGLETLSTNLLAAAIWQDVGEHIRAHIERCGCVGAPGGPDALVAGLGGAGCVEGHPREFEASVAVVIPTIGRGSKLERCLRSLLAQSRSGFEAVIVDNRPDDPVTRELVSALASEDARVRYVAEPRVGSSVARNRGVAETDADIVAFTDDDVVLNRDWLAWLTSAFSEPNVTASTGMVLPLELETPAQKMFEQYGGFSKGVRRQLFNSRRGRSRAPLMYPFFGDVFGNGNSAAFRRADFVAASGFDPALGGGSPAGAGEDIYALTNTILRGGEIVYEPRALCWHEHRRDAESLKRQVFSYGVGFTAILTKAAMSEPRFYTSAARSLPVVARVGRGRFRSNGGYGVPFPRALVPPQRAGMLRGPHLYLRGAVRARRLGLGGVIRGE